MENSQNWFIISHGSVLTQGLYVKFAKSQCCHYLSQVNLKSLRASVNFQVPVVLDVYYLKNFHSISLENTLQLHIQCTFKILYLCSIIYLKVLLHILLKQKTFFLSKR